MRVSSNRRNPSRKRKKLEWLSVLALLSAMVMATGPGVLLINRPETFLGLPLVYAWAILWYFIICGIAFVTNRMIWSKDSSELD